MDEFPKTQTGKIQKNKLREEGITLDTWQNEKI
jgi:acyl-coenzyme A synthetase/AMP-(fatty) acid ligase